MKRIIGVTVFLIFCMGCSQKKGQNVESETKMAEFDSADTIPEMHFQDSSWVYPDIFEGSFEESSSVTQNGLDFRFYKKQIGDLIVSSGKILAADPVTYYDAKPYIHEFPKGSFPVELAIAKIQTDERVAFARIMFIDNQVAEWKFALQEGQSDISIKGSDIYGFGVDAGMGIFIDFEAIGQLNTALGNESSWEKIFINEFDKKYRNTWSYLNYTLQENNLVAFSTGYGDGFFGVYRGIDKEGNICQVLIDFGLIEWWNIKE